MWQGVLYTDNNEADTNADANTGTDTDNNDDNAAQ